MRGQKKKGGKSVKLTRQNYKRRIIAAAILGIIMFGIAVSTFYIEDTKAVEYIQWAATSLVVFSIPIFMGKCSELSECRIPRDIFRILISSIFLWTATLMLVNGCVVVSVAAWNVMHAEEEGEKEKQDKDDTDEEQVKTKVPKRNRTAFVWEEDVFIEDVSKYYDAPINPEDEEQYILALLKEDIENSIAEVADVKGGGIFEDDYEKKTALANQYYNQYLNAVAQGFDLTVQYSELCESKTKRVEANISDKVAANMKELGSTEIELGDLENQMEHKKWQEKYVDALQHYIMGFKCAIQEVELGWYNTDEELKETLWQRIITTYDCISQFDKAEGIMAARADKIGSLLKTADIIK